MISSHCILAGRSRIHCLRYSPQVSERRGNYPDSFGLGDWLAVTARA